MHGTLRAYRGHERLFLRACLLAAQTSSAGTRAPTHQPLLAPTIALWCHKRLPPVAACRLLTWMGAVAFNILRRRLARRRHSRSSASKLAAWRLVTTWKIMNRCRHHAFLHFVNALT